MGCDMEIVVPVLQAYSLQPTCPESTQLYLQKVSIAAESYFDVHRVGGRATRGLGWDAFMLCRGPGLSHFHEKEGTCRLLRQWFFRLQETALGLAEVLAQSKESRPIAQHTLGNCHCETYF